MAIRQPKYSKDEFAQRGDALYEGLRPSVEAKHFGEYAIIDIESGDYEVDPDEMAASDRLLARQPAAQAWMVRIGFPSARRFGPRPAGASRG